MYYKAEFNMNEEERTQLFQEMQQMVADAYLLPGRSDIQCENRTNLSDIPQIPTDWDAMMEVASDTAAKLNEICQ